MEEKLRQTQRLENIELLAGGIAHNFNNALTAIYGYSELLLRSLNPDDPSAADIRQILSITERSAGLTKQLLAFSRQQVMRPERFELNEAVKTAQELLEPLIGTHIDFDLGLHQDLTSVQADPAEIDQVILNLVLNARDAMPDGGRLRIETNLVDLDAIGARRYPDLRPGRYVTLALTASGTGMDTDTLAKVFEPFFTTKEEGHGVGLGLAMVHGAVKRSSGHIEATSVFGRGATFTVFLPLVGDQEDPDTTTHGAAAPSVVPAWSAQDPTQPPDDPTSDH